MSIATVISHLFNQPERPPTDRELADLGLSRVDYQSLISSKPGTRARLEAMAAQFGVTPEMIDADRAVALDIAECCGHCQNAGACENALALGVDFNPERCPNADRYAEMGKS